MYRQPINDAERDRVIAQLQRSRASGHLDQNTLNRRVEIALATQDPDELTDLLADLPDLAGATWTPSDHQQLAPYQARQPQPQYYQQAAQEPAWQQFMRNAAPWLVGAVPIILFIIIFFAPNGFAWWWFIWAFIIFLRPAMRTQQQRHRYQQFMSNRDTQPPPQQPQQPADRHRSEDPDDQDSGSKWQQPPGNPA